MPKTLHENITQSFVKQTRACSATRAWKTCHSSTTFIGHPCDLNFPNPLYLSRESMTPEPSVSLSSDMTCPNVPRTYQFTNNKLSPVISHLQQSPCTGCLGTINEDLAAQRRSHHRRFSSLPPQPRLDWTQFNES